MATFDKPLCYGHWEQWDALELMECDRCHWFYSAIGFLIQDMLVEWDEPLLCDSCVRVTATDLGRPQGWPEGWPEGPPEPRPALAHIALERTRRYVYILKLLDNTFYVGQTMSLSVRLREHRDGLQRQTKGKDPKLVYFEPFVGERAGVKERENELILLNGSSSGRRQIRELIEEFRSPLRLLDLEA